MRINGISPAFMSSMLKKFQQERGDSEVAYLSSHPATDERVRAFEAAR
jgi:predicted Zn-dependent protease